MDSHIAKPFSLPSNFNRLLTIILLVSAALGIGSGIILGTKQSPTSSKVATILNTQPKTAQQDNKTFRDFAEGKIQVKPTPKNPSEYSEGTHLLQRDNGYPVALTSSVVDLSQYEGKNVKVFGETQKALKEGWLMDVGKVEVIQ